MEAYRLRNIFSRLVLVSGRLEDLCLEKKKVPWQLAALTEEHEYKGVGERQWCTLAVHGSH